MPGVGSTKSAESTRHNLLANDQGGGPNWSLPGRVRITTLLRAAKLEMSSAARKRAGIGARRARGGVGVLARVRWVARRTGRSGGAGALSRGWRGVLEAEWACWRRAGRLRGALDAEWRTGAGSGGLRGALEAEWACWRRGRRVARRARGGVSVLAPGHAGGAARSRRRGALAPPVTRVARSALGRSAGCPRRSPRSRGW
jgi:hypothetical protein